MGWGYERQVYAECDICHDSEVSSIRTMAELKKLLRVEGWTFGKKTLCPECNERRKALRASMRRFENGKISDV